MSISRSDQSKGSNKRGNDIVSSETETHNEERLRRLGLGTVQFGMEYGVSNKSGQTTIEEAVTIIQSAAESGMRFIDTAASYGNSETILGKVLPTDHRFNIVTKAIACRSENISKSDCAIVRSNFLDSLKNLKTESVYGLLIHDARELERNGADILFETLLEIKKSGDAKKIGLSVYNGTQIDKVLESYPIDIIQLPMNILDQRLLQSGHLSLLKDRGVEIHVRSSFLQGLLLMDPLKLPERFNTIQSHLTALRDTQTKLAITPLEAALDFVLGIDEIDCVIIGVESESQLRQIFRAAKRKLPVSIDYDNWAWSDESILDPSNWEIKRNDKTSR